MFGNQVLEVETKLREYEVELVALSQQRDGAMENANITAQDLAQYVGKLEERVNDAALIKAELEQQVNAGCNNVVVVVICMKCFLC